MRIWSIHPKYLDGKGLVALWNETLLAKNVLLGKTKGYKNHSQLIRFKKSDNPVDCINQYLAEVYHESIRRNYHFDKSKVDWNFGSNKIRVTTGQMEYETNHLLKKLNVRNISMYNELKDIKQLPSHSLFEIVNGEVEDWEVQTTEKQNKNEKSR